MDTKIIFSTSGAWTTGYHLKGDSLLTPYIKTNQNGLNTYM